MSDMLPRLPYTITLEEELPKGHKDKLPKAFKGSDEWIASKGFKRNTKT